MIIYEEQNMDRKELVEADGITGGSTDRWPYSSGKYPLESAAFLKQCIGNERYDLLINRSRKCPFLYVIARIVLKPDDWNKYVWIEHHGTLEGFPTE